MNAEIHYRCSPDGVACPDVTARLAAAEMAKYQLDLPELAATLRSQAQRFAELHGHGASPEDRSR